MPEPRRQQTDAIRRKALAAFSAAALAAAMLTGCTSTDDSATQLAGVGSGIALGAITSNPVIGLAVGLAVQIAASESIHSLLRARQRTIHQAIASAAGRAEPDQLVPWYAASTIPPGDAFGEVEVVRVFGTHIPCREIVFTAADFPGRAPVPQQGEHSEDPYVKASLPTPEPPEPPRDDFFVAVICEGENGWQWANAEPATERWGGLQ